MAMFSGGGITAGLRAGLRNIGKAPVEGAKGPKAGAQKPTAEGYKSSVDKASKGRYNATKDNMIREIAGATEESDEV